MRAGAEARRARGIGHLAGGFEAFQAAKSRDLEKRTRSVFGRGGCYWAIAARRRRPYAKPRQEPRGAPGTGETRKTEPALYRDRMDTAYRLYLGARNIGSRAFSDRDIALVEAILNEHFHGWTTVKAIGRWKGKTEEALVITFTSHGIKTPPTNNANPPDGAVDTESARATLASCVNQLKMHLGQESVLLEQGGAVGVR
jgi:hypothetical protein